MSLTRVQERTGAVRPAQESWLSQFFGREYLLAFVAVATAMGLRLLLQPVMGNQGRLLLLPFAVMVAAWYGGLGPGIFATVLGMLAGLSIFQILSGSPSAHWPTGGETTQLVLYLLMSVCIVAAGASLRRAVVKAEESSERYQESERRAAEALALLEPMLANAPVGLAFLDPDFRYVRVNEAMAEMHGTHASALVGRTKRELLGEESWRRREPLLRRALGGETVPHIEFPAEPAFGGRDLLVSYYPVRAGGRVLGIGMAMSDVTERRRSERALAESERRLQLALATARMGTWEWNFKTGEVLLSDRMLELYGFTREEFDGTRDFARRFIHPDDLERTDLDSRRAIRAGEDFSMEFRIVNKAGELRWLHSQGTTVADERGAPSRVVGVTTDITDRKLAELERTEALEALRRSEERYQAISELTSDYAYSFALAEGGVFKAEWISEAFSHLIGASGRPVDDLSFDSLLVPEEADEITREAQRLLQGEQYTAEMTFRSSTGERRRVRNFARPRFDETGTRIIGLVGAAQDITEQKRIEDERERVQQALRQSEARLRGVFDANLVGLLYCDTNGRFIGANDKFLELIGYSRAELESQQLEALAITPSEYHDVTRNGLRQAREGGAAPLYEKQYIRKDGTRVPVLIGLTALDDEDDVIVAFVLDLTQLKKTEAELSAANSRLTAALTRERNIAVALQRSLTHMPPQDAFEGLQVHAVYEPAWEEADVGGDFMDAFLLDDEHVAVVVGDVSGKGLTAAARTAEVKYTLRGLFRERRSPAAALNGLNEYLCDARRRGVDSGEEFICVSVAVVECSTGKLVLSVAGAEPPLFVRQDGGTREAEVRGTPLGVFAEMEYRDEPAELGHGDLLVLTTDGITEARRGGEFFGYEGLTGAAVRLRHTADLTDLANQLVTEARDFAGGALHDDTCLLLVRRN